MKVAAGIVLFNPDTNRLHENLRSIKPQVDIVIIVDNSLKDNGIHDLAEQEGIIYIYNQENRGIAYALNQIFSYCQSYGYEWVISLDQDSVVSNDIIDVYKKYLLKDVGIVCPKVIDRNFSTKRDELDYEIKEIGWCITSASLTNVRAWHEVGGFDNSMFIDWVDLDFCIALRSHGYKILQTMKTQILHELGDNSRILKFGGREIYLLNRPSWRYYYVVRNYIYIGRKWKERIGLRGKLREAVETIFFVTLMESNKQANFKAMIKGLIDGYKMPIVYSHIER